MAEPKNQYSNLVAPFAIHHFCMDFDRLYEWYFDQLTYITMRLIILDGLPETIDETFLKYCLITLGKIVFFQLDESIPDLRQSKMYPLQPGDLVALPGNKSDVQTIYYMNRNVNVTNPVFTKTYHLTPGKDCEIVYCTEPDKYRIFGYGGLYALIARTATILADNDISINCAQKNTRLVNVIGADDQTTATSAECAVRAMYDGQPYIVVQSNLIGNLSSIPMTQKTSSGEITQLIEMRQYIYSHFYEALGLQTHDNMKKERLITEEINDNAEISALNIDDIITSIQDGLNRVNAMFDTNITASINPIVLHAHDEDDAAMDPDPLLDPEPEPEPEPEQKPEPEQEPEPEPEQEPEPARAETPADDQTEDQIDAAAAADQEEEKPQEIAEKENEKDPKIEKIEINAEDNAEITVIVDAEEVIENDVPAEDDAMVRDGAAAAGTTN